MTNNEIIERGEITISCRNKDLHDETLDVAAAPTTALRDVTAHLLDEDFLMPLAGNEVWDIRIERTNRLVGNGVTLADAAVVQGDVLHWTRSVNGAV